MTTKTFSEAMDIQMIHAILDDVAENGWAGPVSERLARRAQQVLRSRGIECSVNPSRSTYIKGEYFEVRRAGA